MRELTNKSWPTRKQRAPHIRSVRVQGLENGVFSSLL
jgi:hypothetical protein